MSTTTVLKQGIDADVEENRPADNFGKADRLRLSSTTPNQRQALLFFGSLPHPGVYVISATLHLKALTGFSSQTLTVKRITAPWKERTVTWRTRPSATAFDAVTTAVTLSPDNPLDIDVTPLVRDALLGNGLPFYGFQISTSATGPVSFHSSEDPRPWMRPTLTITYAQTPTVAADLVPGDGDVVSIAFPVLRWTYFDLEGDEQGAFKVQVCNNPDFTGPIFDSGWVTSTDPQLDLATTSYGGLPDTDSAWWRVMVQDDTGQTSEFSDAVHIFRIAKAMFTLDAPSASVEETTPTITTTLHGVQRGIAYTIEESNADGTWRVVWEQKRMAAPAVDGDDYSFRVPLIAKHSPIRLRDWDYRLTVRAWDDIIGRVATSGDETYVEVQRVFQWNDAVDSPVPPVLLVASAAGPGVALGWARPAVPDAWALLVDGEVAQDHADPIDWQVTP